MSLDALNVSELSEAWEADRVLIRVQPGLQWLQPAWYGACLLAPMVLGAFGTLAMGVGEPSVLVVAVAAGLTVGAGFLVALGVTWSRVFPEAIDVGHTPTELVLDRARLPIREVVDVRWSGGRLCAEDRDGRHHYSRPVRPRDRARLLRILHAPLLADADREAEVAGEREARARLDPLLAPGSTAG